MEGGHPGWPLWRAGCSLTRQKANTCIWRIPHYPITLLITYDCGTPITLELVSWTKDLGIRANSTLKPIIQVNAASVKAQNTLFIISRTFERLTPIYLFLPTQFRLVLECYVEAWVSYTARDVDKLKSVPSAATRRAHTRKDFHTQTTWGRLTTAEWSVMNLQAHSTWL